MISAIPASKIKILLIPILLCIFGWVIWTNILSKSQPDPALQLTAALLKTAPSTTSWPLNQFDTASAYNPFQAIGPDNLPVAETSTSVETAIAGNSPVQPNPSTPAETIPAVEDLDSQSMTLLIQKGNRSVAVFGDQTIETGQKLRNGAKVESIDADGVISTSTSPQ